MGGQYNICLVCCHFRIYKNLLLLSDLYSQATFILCTYNLVLFPSKISRYTSVCLTLCFCSSVRTSLRTLAQGMSSGHHTGLQLSLPQPGFPLPVEYFNISGINARSCA